MDELHEQEASFSRLIDRLAGQVPERPEHRDALRQRALAAFDAAGQRQTAPTAWEQMANQSRGILRQPVFRFVAAAAMCLTVVAGRLLVPGQLSTAQAFERFAAAIIHAKSATFRSESHIEGHKKEEERSYYLAPGKLRNETEGTVDILDTKAGKRVILTPAEKRAVVINYINRAKKPDKPQLIDVFEQMRDLVAETRGAQDDEFMRFEPLGEKEIDGHRAIGFSHATPLESLSLWGDPDTGLPVLVEIVWSGTPKNALTMSHFELNEKLDPALFDTTPPAGFKVQTFHVDFSKPTEATLIEALRLVTDLNDGFFVNELNGGVVTKQALRDDQTLSGGRGPAPGDKKSDQPNDLAAESTLQTLTVARGIGFALKLPESADAHYAGEGVKRDEPDRPIFWYKPAGSKAYRVIFADLSSKDADAPPEIAGAVRLGNPRPAAGQDK